MERFLFLKTRGRNTGIWRPREVWYVQLAGSFYLLAESGERPDWVMNIEANPTVSFSIGTRRNEVSELPQTSARGRILRETSDGEMCARVRAAMFAKYRWGSGTLIELTVSN